MRTGARTTAVVKDCQVFGKGARKADATAQNVENDIGHAVTVELITEHHLQPSERAVRAPLPGRAYQQTHARVVEALVDKVARLLDEIKQVVHEQLFAFGCRRSRTSR